MKITEGQIKFLLVLLIAALLAIPYFFVIQPQMETAEALEREIEQLRERRMTLERHTAAIPEYQEGLLALRMDKDSIFSRYPSELPQEATIMFIHETERMIPLRMQQVNFALDSSQQIVGDESAAAHAAVIAAQELTPLIVGLDGVRNTTQITFDSTYEEFKSLLAHVANFPHRMVIPRLRVSFNGDCGTASGDFNLNQFAIDGENRDRVFTAEPEMELGADNIFFSLLGWHGGWSDIPDELWGTDLYLILSQPEADIEAKILAMYGDIDGTSRLTSTVNATEDMTITFTGEEGLYSVAYRIGEVELATDYYFITLKGFLTFQVNSSPRVGSNDQVGVRVNLINRSDLPLYVKIDGDDPDEARISFPSLTGSIYFN
ncbi:MAG: hypothetical protein LBC96_06700 [Lachnospiraceae bacterium]|jgi:hypothetical protein|nr:hypothetical protein [Lachnospiraceae bacterium]